MISNYLKIKSIDIFIIKFIINITIKILNTNDPENHGTIIKD